MSNHITPTTGRIVYYRGEDGQVRAAIVTQVNGDFNLNLHVFPLGFMDADAYMKENITHADPDVEPGCFPSWHWMPYQKQQVEKAEAKGQAACSVGAVGQLTGARDASCARAQAIEMALRTPGLHHHSDVLKAATAYQLHIEGEATQQQHPAPGAAHPGYSTLQPHQQRVVDEKAELDGRLEKLGAFTDTAVFASLDKDEQSRLFDQAEAMQDYSEILGARIAAFTPA